MKTLQRITDPGPEEWRARLAAWGAPRFRAAQIFRWVAGRGVLDPEAMSDLPRELRRQLRESFDTSEPAARWSRDPGSETEKVLLELADGEAVEAVLIMEGARTTTCLSTQVGCPVGCRFCASGLLGLRRNLGRGEILDQFIVLRRRAAELGRRVGNVVMMGMGEPLLNYEATLGALDVLNHPDGGGIGARHLTVSTIGLRKGLERLQEEGRQYTLAISLHAPDDETRRRIVPFAAAMPVAELARTARRWLEGTGREVTFEYVLLEGINAAADHARRLAKLLEGVQGTVNLIPYNENPGLPFLRPAPRAVDTFARILRRGGLKVSVRKRKGNDILAACGQLRLQELGPGGATS
jgi:23S rRNA (adenine2503-C2)-methyltransferase